MMRQRKSLLLAALTFFLGCSFLSPGGKAEEKTIQPVQNLTIFDGGGKRVGTVLGFNFESTGGLQGFVQGGDATVAMRIAGELVILYVRLDRFIGKEQGFTLDYTNATLRFESSNCAGTPYIPAPNVPPTPPLAPLHVLNGTRLYALGGPPRSIVLRSIEQNSSCSPVNPVESVQEQPLRFLIDLSTQFQPPFTMR
ncbi:MAG: hypothetical protein A3H28_03510 [Acidobacteria bacterium RIFCSPLOWO2_02_FULL_61_28]|nr:MAG: hypothetical protein A3H28_03510 [Acidobacteria bacterium RIFCSPLOWO2_02_FULL_61_28]